MDSIVIDLSSDSEHEVQEKKPRLHEPEQIVLSTDEEDNNQQLKDLPNNNKISKEENTIQTIADNTLQSGSVSPDLLSTILNDPVENGLNSPNSPNLLVELREEPYQPDSPQKQNGLNAMIETCDEADTEENEARTEVVEVTPPVVKLPVEIEEFLSKCEKNLAKSKLSPVSIRRKIRTVRTTALQATIFIQTEDFKIDLQSFNDQITKDSTNSAVQLLKLYKLLLANEDPVVHSIDLNDTKRTVMLDSLYDKLEKVQERIKELESQEVDFSDEENSAYLKLAKYEEKAAEIVCAIAKLQQHSPYTGIAYFYRLDFSQSKIEAFNHALNKKYRNRELHTFPTMFDVDKCLRRCAKKNNLKLNEAELRAEIAFCFKEFGKLLKKRRQRDLRSVHNNYLNDKDPALGDPELEQKLKDNRRTARSKLDNVLAQYTALQESGINPGLSDDSDDSRHADSDDDTDDMDDGHITL